MQPIEDQLKDYQVLVQEIDQNYAEAVRYWWNKWHRFVEYDTEQEMQALIPDWIKSMVSFIETHSMLKGIKIRYNYERGLFQTDLKTVKTTPNGVEY